jgi:hypothetical protein
MPHLTWKQRLAFVAGGATIALVGGLAGPASAHTLTGGSAQATCDAGTVAVTWSFVSGDANGHHITSVQFDRRIDATDVTVGDTTITAHTTEKAGATVELTATAIFEDGFHSSRSVTTTIRDDVCSPVTTTTAPPPATVATTIPPTPLTTLPMVESSVVQSPDLTVPAVPSSVEESVPGGSPAPPGPTTTSRIVLPVTGGGDWALAGVAVGAFLILVGLVLVTARRQHEDEL